MNLLGYGDHVTSDPYRDWGSVEDTLRAQLYETAIVECGPSIRMAVSDDRVDRQLWMHTRVAWKRVRSTVREYLPADHDGEEELVSWYDYTSLMWRDTMIIRLIIAIATVKSSEAGDRAAEALDKLYRDGMLLPKDLPAIVASACPVIDGCRYVGIKGPSLVSRTMVLPHLSPFDCVDNMHIADLAPRRASSYEKGDRKQAAIYSYHDLSRGGIDVISGRLAQQKLNPPAGWESDLWRIDGIRVEAGSLNWQERMADARRHWRPSPVWRIRLSLHECAAKLNAYRLFSAIAPLADKLGLPMDAPAPADSGDRKRQRLDTATMARHRDTAPPSHKAIHRATPQKIAPEALRLYRQCSAAGISPDDTDLFP